MDAALSCLQEAYRQLIQRQRKPPVILPTLRPEILKKTLRIRPAAILVGDAMLWTVLYQLQRLLRHVWDTHN